MPTPDRSPRAQPPLSPAATLQLWRRSRAGDREAFARLFASLEGLCCALAARRARRDGLAVEDLQQQARLACAEALRDFDPGRRVPLAAWAATAIHRALADYAAAERRLGGVPVRLPRRVWRELRQLEEAELQLRRAGRPVSREALAALSGLRPARVAQLRGLQHWTAVGDEPPDEGAELVDGLLRDQQVQALRRALEHLPEQLRRGLEQGSAGQRRQALNRLSADRRLRAWADSG